VAVAAVRAVGETEGSVKERGGKGGGGCEGSGEACGIVVGMVVVGRLGVEMEAERVEVMAAAGMAAVTEVVVRGAVRGAVRTLAGKVEATKVAAVQVVVLR
jgi:hypothetical protein